MLDQIASPAPSAAEAKDTAAPSDGNALSPEQKPELLGAYKLMLEYQFFGAVCLVGVLGVALLYSYLIAVKWNPPLMIFVAAVGVLGAYFSSLTRLYNVDQLSVALITPTVSKLGGGYLLMYSLVPAIIGAIAAVVLYVIFLAGLMGSGGVFPAITCKIDKCSTLFAVLRYFEPSEAQDYCKVLVWAFAAGFSERLVPNTLTSLAAKMEKTDQ